MSTDAKADAKAAHEFLTELRTRIATQPLPYQYGVEARALTSMWEVFTHARAAMCKNPGCEEFARRTTEKLNLVVRPLTAKWHRAYEEGRLNSRDGGDAFRSELLGVQARLREFAAELHEMAYQQNLEDKLTPEVMSKGHLDQIFEHPVAFGFVPARNLAPEQAGRIATDEAVCVQRRRDHRKSTVPPGQNAVGLALSGGGIRSASFSLGVVQVLAQRGLLGDVDFLSTVSGGGYTGSFLIKRLDGGADYKDLAAPFGPDTDPISYLRQNARYLSGHNLKERLSMVCATIAGMMLNWATPLLMIIVCVLIAHGCGATLVAYRLLALRWLAAVTAAAMIVYGAGMRGGKTVSRLTGRFLGWTLALTLAVAATAGLDAVFDGWFALDDPQRLASKWKATSGSLIVAVGCLGSLLPAMTRLLPIFKNPKARQLELQVALWIVGLFMPCLAITLFYLLLGFSHAHLDGLLAVGALLAAVAFFVVNVNLTSPHRLYRDDLARTFIWTNPRDDAPVPLKGINEGGVAPYHILNATLNVPSSETASLKDRGCDFFMFSRSWTGSVATGYHPTGHWKSAGRTDLDLATAMAVSGAAVSTHMGLGSLPTLTAVLTVLNVRLGFWIKHPTRPGLFPFFKSPGFLCLLRETLSWGMNENAKWLNLSDGGHIENMAVYELLRRRCKFIVCVDGEADPAFTFGGLMTLVRHARIDFGVTIAPLLDEVRPRLPGQYCGSHFHLCRVEYPVPGQPSETGLLLYLKSSVTGNESELIRCYRAKHPGFPHQNTLDQFFDQEQFEAYRQLGVHVAEGMFKPALTHGTRPTSVPEWFRALAKNLLEPTATESFPPVPV